MSNGSSRRRRKGESETKVRDLLLGLEDAYEGSRPAYEGDMKILEAPAGTRFGKYILEKEIGRGGAGVVYEALDTALNRKCALKMLVPGKDDDPEDGERFEREARLSASLPKHPHIVGVYEAGIIRGKRFIAMELVDVRKPPEGGRVSTAPGIWKSLNRRQKVRVLRDVALAVDHAHANGVIHRDLKPANILIDANVEPHVSDFGLARPIRPGADLALTKANQTVGTPTYMSPEQAQGWNLDRRSDVYSLGVMLYEILTGKPPFRGSSPMEIMMKVVNDPVVKPSTASGGTAHQLADKTIEKICLRAISKRPAQRHASAKGFANDLSRWLEGEVVKVEPNWKERMPLLVAGGALALGILVLGVALAGRPDRAAKEAPRAAASSPEAAPIPDPVNQEGESLKVLSATHGAAVRQGAGQTVLSKGQWSGNAQLLWTEGRPRDRLRLAFRSPVAARGSLALALTRGPDCAIVRVTVNGTLIEGALDLYAPVAMSTDEVEYRGVEFKSGENELVFEITGINSASRRSVDLQLGLDYVALRALRPSRP